MKLKWSKIEILQVFNLNLKNWKLKKLQIRNVTQNKMEVEIQKLLKVKWKDKYKYKINNNNNNNNNNIDQNHIT